MSRIGMEKQKSHEFWLFTLKPHLISMQFISTYECDMGCSQTYDTRDGENGQVLSIFICIVFVLIIFF